MRWEKRSETPLAVRKSESQSRTLFPTAKGETPYIPKSLSDKPLSATNQECANGRGRSGGQIARGHPKASPRPRQLPFLAPALRELESACRVSIFRDAVTVRTVCFSGALRRSPEGVSSSLRPKPPASICSVQIKPVARKRGYN